MIFKVIAKKHMLTFLWTQCILQNTVEFGCRTQTGRGYSKIGHKFNIQSHWPWNIRHKITYK